MKEDSIVFAEKNQATLPRARARYLAQAIQLEESNPPNVIPAAVATTIFLLFSIIFWAALTKVSEVAIADGEVVPAGLIHNVQHLEGGIVSELLVRNGDQVKKGDVLLRFVSSSSGPELEQMRIRRTNLLLQGERLQALVEERNPDFSFAGKRYDELMRKQLTIYQSQVKSKQSELAVIESQIRQRQREITRQKNQVKGLKVQT